MLKIQKGKYRGRTIALPPRVSGNVNCTPALVKEAFFQILENRRLPDQSAASNPFFDLCGGSGQMAFEALSQGYFPVHISEVNEDRLRFLLDEAARYSEKVLIHKRDFRRMAPLILAEKNPVVYLDPPYSFWKKKSCEPVDRLLFNLVKGLAEKQEVNSVFLVVQGPEEYFPDQSVKEAVLRHCVEYNQYSRDYRGNQLTVIQFGLQE